MRAARPGQALRIALSILLMVASASAMAIEPIEVRGEPAPISEKSAAAFDLRMPDYPTAASSRFEWPPLAAERAQAVREYNSREGSKRLQIGVERSLKEESHQNGSPALEWRALADGAHVARLTVHSPGAAALRVGLSTHRLPAGAELRFFSEAQSQSVVPAVSPAEVDRADAELYWTPVTEGDTQLIEIYLPAAVNPALVQLVVDRVSHMLASPYGPLDGLKIGESDPCEIDANCVTNPSTAYINAKNSVARMSFQVGGSAFVCTGTLLNDTVSGSFIPYFFSANHCISTQAAASTLTTFWFEESTSCGSGIASARTQVSGGAQLLYNNANTDILLLRLNNPAPSGAFFAGWSSTTVTAATNVLVLHHPAGDVKKVSQGQITGFGTFNGAGDFIKAGYTAGTTEGGSSGSGLLTFNGSEYQVRGGLFGGSASCSNTGNINNPGNSDAYSRFDTAFPFLMPFLAPSGGGTTQALQNGVPVSGLSGATGAALAFTVAIPAGAQNLVITTAGGSGDPDLYVRFGSPPTTSTFDCRSFANGPAEQCTFATPSAGTYHVLISGFSAFSGLTLTASWQTGGGGGGGGGVDEPSFTGFALPVPANFPNCPAGYFVATVTDGPGAGLTPGIFGMELLLNPPGTQRLEGGLNFGGLVDGSQVAFAGFNFQNAANEPQRLNLSVTGAPSSNRAGSLPVRIKVIRQPAANVNELVLETTASLTLATPFTRSIELTPAYYVVTVAPEGAASVPGGAADGEVYVSATTQFVNRAGGGFFAGAVVGGYHAAHPFGGVSGFAAICLSDPHSSTARVLSAPSYGATGARDLRLQLFDAQNQLILSVPN
ncbi:MAG: pre-peptidase C-terminal domain-containing protein [Xanthomonadales bacterium]|nr:pre-peptidase C-terminal domain-containing protein [Xanthomonadales bacterium]MCP5476834.1 pre-peptidase C-terminal domain-containing protein [Rhodanobacteraceae bacterium]